MQELHIDTTHIYDIRDVDIPESVTYNGKAYKVTGIEVGAFFGAFIESITIPESVTSIGDFAFYNSQDLKSINIPSSVTSIGRRAFDGCTNLKYVNIFDLDSWCKIIFFDRFANPLCKSGHLYLNGKEIKKLDIPNSVTSIGNWAFYGCDSLTSIKIPNSVTSIGRRTFSGCTNLTSINIPDSVTNIGGGAFSRCTNLTSINIPNSVKEIGRRAFDYNLKELYINSKTPPIYNPHPKYNLDIPKQCTLHIPKGCKGAYENEKPWCDFTKIVDEL